MTDTIQDFSAPPEAPAAADDPAQHLSQRGRPSKVVERDLAVARVLAERERSKHEVMAALGLEWRVTYNSLCRLRDQGYVELNRNGTRTPTWRVTDAGHAWLGTAPPAVEEPAEEPTPEVAEAPPAPPTPPEPAPVAEVPAPPPAPVEEPGAQPVPISPPPPEPEPQPQGVAPSPGPAEPVWPI